ncbi:TylF/MycF/NovP-related O-methyltransferase [Roseibium album]|uniref:TylF/MycF/NovP-related O-methyltransferase n=1 Tax=Roseibium album TaxID=311410 RepID=UPI002491BDD9|nr:TylF/MycF/NovP-related O-methyltransferase [Roseibium album]
MLIKQTLGHVLSDNPKIKALALKVSAYPDFLRFQETFAVPELISGEAREKRNKLFQAVSDREGLSTIPLRYFEFGVHEGASLNWWSETNRHPASRFFGFDSFEGLPEDWSTTKQAGYFSTDLKLPETDDARVDFVPGWFHRTLPLMLQKLETEDRAVIHMDADLYRSTIYPLCVIGSHLKDGDILIFDEFLDSSHEFRAFDDARSIFGWKFEVLAATEQYAQVAIKLNIAEAPVWRRS